MAHHSIDYVEIPSRDLDATKRFFADVFGLAFKDYGADYASFSGGGVDGGFFRSPAVSQTDLGGALIVFHSDDLEATLAAVEAAGGKLTKPIFSFPGGRRFHFSEPSGNEFAVWSDKPA